MFDVYLKEKNKDHVISLLCDIKYFQGIPAAAGAAVTSVMSDCATP